MPTDKHTNDSPGNFAHAMRREIYEQPDAISRTIEKHLKDDIIFPGELQAIEGALLTFEKLIIAASGSSLLHDASTSPRQGRWGDTVAGWAQRLKNSASRRATSNLRLSKVST